VPVLMPVPLRFPAPLPGLFPLPKMFPGRPPGPVLDEPTPGLPDPRDAPRLPPDTEALVLPAPKEAPKEAPWLPPDVDAAPMDELVPPPLPPGWPAK